MKAGANQMDIAKIKKLADEGKSAFEISRILSIEESVVENFMPEKPKAAKSTKAAKTSDDLV